MPKGRLATGQKNIAYDSIRDQYVFRKRASGGGEVEIPLKAKTLKQAIRERDELLQEMGAGRITGGKRRTVAKVAFKIIDIMERKAEKTFEDFETTARLHLLPVLGHCDVNRVGARWEHYKAVQRGKNPNRKLTHDRKHLIRILRYAHRERPLANGLPELPLDLADKHVRLGHVYTTDEVKRLVRAAGPRWRLILDLAVIYGMRIGEILKLRREYVDFDRHEIRLPSRTIKTREPRVIPIEVGTERAIRAVLHLDSPWVFPNRRDPQRPMRHYGRSWKRLKARARVTHGTFHDIRHTNVTWALELGHAPALIQKTRGMSPQVMERIYAHSQLRFASQLNREIRGRLRENVGKKPRRENANTRD